uniref:Selenoprotein O n=1 Tax=Ganoderma boninense TaxID=34458 RepID=A0A5K1K287_9APHY|nr:MFS domain-containing protein [Ganoderma boninense]
MRALLNALSPLIGAENELGGKAVSPGWAEKASKEQVQEWSKRGTELVKEEMERIVEETCAVEYGRLMHKRLGLRRIDQDNESKLAQPLLSLMRDHSLDFHGTFRHLCFFKPSIASSDDNRKAFIDSILKLTSEPNRLDPIRAQSDWSDWLRKYAARIESERDHWDGEADVDAAREREAKGANPRFVLRQWLLEEVIKKVETDAESGKRVLAKVLQMACKPYEPWGAEGQEDDSGLDAEAREERRYCGMGERRLLGFQCSCSS